MEPPDAHATNKFGKNSWTSSASDGAFSTPLSVVSNSFPQIGQCQILTVSRAATVSDHSGKINITPQRVHSAEHRSDAVIAMWVPPFVWKNYQLGIGSMLPFAKIALPTNNLEDASQFHAWTAEQACGILKMKRRASLVLKALQALVQASGHIESWYRRLC
jgi:hypothetical protein